MYIFEYVSTQIISNIFLANKYRLKVVTCDIYKLSGTMTEIKIYTTIIKLKKGILWQYRTAVFYRKPCILGMLFIIYILSNTKAEINVKITIFIYFRNSLASSSDSLSPPYTIYMYIHGLLLWL